MRTFARMFVLVALVGCSSAQRGGGVCSPRSAQRCLTPVVCDVDRVLGCEVCRCSDAPYVPMAGPR